MPRIYTPQPLQARASLALDPAAARHVQVLRLQPGEMLTLFNGQGGEFSAKVEKIGRSEVQVQVLMHHALEREAARPIHIAIGMPANERMDWFVEKATELGAASIQPLICERSVLRLTGERAEKKRAHWQAIATAACEQCGRNRLPLIHSPILLEKWLVAGKENDSSAIHSIASKYLLSLDPDALPVSSASAPSHEAVLCLSGPEGGLSPAEEQAARQAGFQAISLGQRVLRAETAPLVALAVWTQYSPMSM